MLDLIERLRALSRHEHSDMTIGDEAADALEAARAEVERSERYAEQSERERLWAESRVERLAEALRRYGVHDQACVAANIPICTCGLDAAIEQEDDRG